MLASRRLAIRARRAPRPCLLAATRGWGSLMAVDCSKCRYQISEEEGKVPPWCPRCGSDLRRVAAQAPAELEIAGAVVNGAATRSQERAAEATPLQGADDRSLP